VITDSDFLDGRNATVVTTTATIDARAAARLARALPFPQRTCARHVAGPEARGCRVALRVGACGAVGRALGSGILFSLFSFRFASALRGC